MAVTFTGVFIPVAVFISICHLSELVELIDPMLADKAVTGDEAKQMFDALNRTRLEILNLWADGESAKHLEVQLPR